MSEASDAKHPKIHAKRNKTNSAPNLEWRGFRRGTVAPWRSTKITVPLTPTGRPRKRMNTQEREQRNETRQRKKAERSAAEEHERRSKAAKKGWDRLSAEERTARAKRGWETRDLRSGRARSSRNSQKLAGEARDYRQHKRKPDFGQPPPGTYRGGNKFPF